MTKPLLDTVTAGVKRHFGEQAHILVAFSGGIDSCVLLDLLWRLRQQGAIQHLEALHVDHDLRPSSDRDALHCRRFAGARRIPLTIVKLDHGGSLSQAQARQRRLSALVDRAYDSGAQALALAHHGDDRIETALINARRGSGLDGLSAMSLVDPAPVPGPRLPLFRPLIDHLKSDLQAYASSRGIDHARDPTNSTDKYARNQLRHQVIDDFLATPSERRRFLGTLNNLSDERRAADQYAIRLLKQASRDHDGDIRAHHLALSPLQQAPDAEVARLLLNLVPTLNQSHIKTLQRTIASPTSSNGPQRLSLPQTLCTVTDERITLQPAFARGGRDVLQRPIEPVNLAAPSGKASFFGFSIRWEPWPPGDENPATDPWSTALKLDDYELPLCLGPPDTGEEIHRLDQGKSYHQALNTWLSSQSVPHRYRQRWPCVYDNDGHLRWVAGRRRAEPRPSDRPPSSTMYLQIRVPREIVEIFHR